MIDVEGVSPQGLLAVTFTNKAAAEMRGRIESLLNMPVNHLWIGTFHGLAHRLLRRHWREAGLPQNFQIIDSDDQLRLIKRLLKNLEIDDSRWAPREVQYFINRAERRRPATEDISMTRATRTCASRLRCMQPTKRSVSVAGWSISLSCCCAPMSFGATTPSCLRTTSGASQHLLVDEFQDTNSIQYAWLRLLAGKTGIPFVVGDDDQSIYRWRGARVEHIHRFQKDFPGTVVVKLEQNYRSTGTILNAANAVIENNSSRLGKKLWTEGADGEPIESTLLTTSATNRTSSSVGCRTG